MGTPDACGQSSNAQTQTNTEFVADLMDFPKSGVLMQVFVIEAIRLYAQQVESQPPLENHIIDGNAWKACAQEALGRLEAKYGKG